LKYDRKAAKKRRKTQRRDGWTKQFLHQFSPSSLRLPLFLCVFAVAFSVSKSRQPLVQRRRRAGAAEQGGKIMLTQIKASPHKALAAIIELSNLAAPNWG
jgi:hypothetical protein